MANVLSDSFDAVTDTDRWLTAAVVFVSFLGLTVIKAFLEDHMNIYLPDEVYSVAVIIVAEFVAGDYKRNIQIGGGLYTVDQLAERRNEQDLRQYISRGFSTARSGTRSNPLSVVTTGTPSDRATPAIIMSGCWMRWPFCSSSSRMRAPSRACVGL